MFRSEQFFDKHVSKALAQQQIIYTQGETNPPCVSLQWNYVIRNKPNILSMSDAERCSQLTPDMSIN